MIDKKMKEYLNTNNLNFYEFPDGTTPTSVDAAEKLGVEVGQIAKTILFIGKSKKTYLIVCSGNRKISSSKLKKTIGEKAKLASYNETEKFTGYTPGGVCPFLVNVDNILIDESLNNYEKVFSAAGSSGSAVEANYELLLKLTEGISADITVEKE